MWLYYCLLSTVIWGFIAIAIKKCSNNEPKRIADFIVQFQLSNMEK